MNKTNKELARIFNRMAAIYEMKEEDNQFRVRAYENAARVIDNLPEDVTEILDKGEKLEEIHGIGESIADKIREYIDTGKIEKYESLQKEMPEDFFDLLKVEGIGPKTLQRLRDELRIKTKEDLVEALESGEVEELKGFGHKTVENMLEGIARREEASDRILLSEAAEIAEEIKKELQACCDLDKVEVAGSIRRHRATIGDIDVIVTAGDSDRKKIMDCFTGMEEVSKVVASGKKKATVQIKTANRDVDLRIFEEGEFGAALLYFTGSKAHNVHLRKMAREKDWKINEYGLFSGDKKLAGKTEASIYSRLGLQWVPPEMREDEGEIEMAADEKIPDLIQFEDIRGDLHVHSTWSDGNYDLDEIAEFVRDHFDYEYLVITEHSKSQTQAGGLDAPKIRKQKKEIEKVNDSLGKVFLRHGIEVDIMPDGSLDLPDDVLEELEWVVASIHSRFKQDNTERILKAMENPFVNAIGHPSGRMIGQRDAYPLDMEKIMEKAAATGTALEVNVSPPRMDLNDRWIRAARDKEVMLVINTDSHNLGDFSDMRLGAAYARRGWCEKEKVLNTRNWKAVKDFVEKKRP